MFLCFDHLVVKTWKHPSILFASAVFTKVDNYRSFDGENILKQAFYAYYILDNIGFLSEMIVVFSSFHAITGPY